MDSVRTIRPAFEEQLPPAFSPSSPAVFFDRGSNTMFTSSWITQPAPMSWWRAHDCDIAALVAAAGLIALLLAVVLVIRRPQAPGGMYCEHCNYDLTPTTPVLESSSPGLTASAGLTTTLSSTEQGRTLPAASCPECGLSTQEHPPRHGRSLPRRLAPWFAVLVPLIAIGGWRCGGSLQLSRAGSQAWPAAWLSRVFPGWPISRVQPPNVMTCTLASFSLEKARGNPVFVNEQFTVPTPSPGGDRVCWLDFSKRTQWTHTFLVIRPEDGKENNVNLSAISSGFPSIEGFTNDRKAAVLVFCGETGPETSGQTKARIVTIDLDSLAVRKVGTLTAKMIPLQSNGWQTPQILAAVRSAEPPDWAAIVMDGPDAGKITVETTAGRIEGRAGNLTSVQAEQLQITEGSKLLLSRNIPGGDRWAIGLDQSVERVYTAPKIQIRPDGPNARLFLDGVEKAVLENADMRSTSISGSLSPDGRWYGAIVSPFDRKPAQIRVWEVEPRRPGDGAR